MQQVKPSVMKVNGKERPGRGFSPRELKAAGVSTQVAARVHIPIDKNRKTVHEGNVEIVKAFVSKQTEAKAKAKAEVKVETAKESKKKAKT